MQKSYRALLFVLFISFSLLSNAQKEWTLAECLTYAEENSLTIQQGQFNNEINNINLEQAKQSRYPNLNANVNLNWSAGLGVDPLTNLLETRSFLQNGYGISSNVTLFRGFQISNSIEQARLDAIASQYDIDVTKSNLALNIATAYVNALVAKENLKNASSNIELTQSQLDRTDKMISAGSIPRNDRLNILAQISRDDQSIINAQNSLDLALLNLAQLINYSGSETFIIANAPDVLVTEDPFAIQVDQVYQSAKKTFLKSDEYRYQSAELGVEIAEGGLLPILSLGGNISSRYGYAFDSPLNIDFTKQIDDNLGYGAGLNLQIPIFNNYNIKANIERAKISRDLVSNQNAQNSQVLQTTVQNVLTDARAFKKQYEASEKTLEAEKASYENAEKRFELGAINSFDLINANNQFNAARINNIIAKYNYLFKMKILDFYLGKPLSLND